MEEQRTNGKRSLLWWIGIALLITSAIGAVAWGGGYLVYGRGSAPATKLEAPPPGSIKPPQRWLDDYAKYLKQVDELREDRQRAEWLAKQDRITGWAQRLLQDIPQGYILHEGSRTFIPRFTPPAPVPEPAAAPAPAQPPKEGN